MTVWGSKRELSHAPRLVMWRLQDLSTDASGCAPAPLMSQPPPVMIGLMNVPIRSQTGPGY